MSTRNLTFRSPLLLKAMLKLTDAFATRIELPDYPLSAAGTGGHVGRCRPGGGDEPRCGRDHRLARSGGVGRTGAPSFAGGRYGEAGAIDRYGPAVRLPHAHSGHNAYGLWGPPPPGAGPVIAVGLPVAGLAEHLRDCAPAGRIDNRAGIDNDERGAPIVICAGPRGSWAAVWPTLRHLG
jgi:hypothetical protein